MNGVPNNGLCKSHGTPARILGTTQSDGLFFSRVHEDPWWVWASTFFLVTLTSVVLYPSFGEARRFSVDLSKQHLSPQHQKGNQTPEVLIAERASSSMVGTIMALLATFDEAGILPPEGTPQANQIIHGFIQLQSALMKSPSSELVAYRDAAFAQWTQQNPEKVGSLPEEGLTDRLLAALVLYDLEHPLWEDQKIVTAFRKFNVSRSDWQLIVELFHQAEGVFRNQGRTIHEVYETWRMSMPGRKS